MRVKIGSQWHDSELEPICVQLSVGEQRQIAGMDRAAAPNGKYAVFPSGWERQQAIEWMSDGEHATGWPIAAILAERRRQVSVEGWTPEHDDSHTDGDLAKAAAAYALNASSDANHAAGVRLAELKIAPTAWPWCSTWWKPRHRRRDLVRAGALVVAELERLNRAEERAREESGPAACLACNSQPGQYHAPECPAVDAFTAGRIPSGQGASSTACDDQFAPDPGSASGGAE